MLRYACGVNKSPTGPLLGLWKTDSETDRPVTAPTPPVKVYAPHVKMTMSGTLGAQEGSPEAWSMSLSLRPSGWFNTANEADRRADAIADIKAFWARPESGIANIARLTSVKFAPIGTNGKYTGDPTIDDFLPVLGAGGPLLHPYNVSLCVSLVTERRGPTGKGRIYLPLPSLAVQPNGLCGNNAVQGVAVSVQTLLNGLNNAPGFDVADSEVVVSSSKGYLSLVTGVRVGLVLDTIRSRRTALPEGYGATLAVS